MGQTQTRVSSVKDKLPANSECMWSPREGVTDAGVETDRGGGGSTDRAYSMVNWTVNLAESRTTLVSTLGMAVREFSD